MPANRRQRIAPPLRRRGAAGAMAILMALVSLLMPRAAAAQSDGTAAFTLASSQIFSTRDRPAISLTYRGVTQLDFRTYRVQDPFAFFAQLKDAHQLGSEEPVVPQERTWLERIADWKRARRSVVRGFVRAQFSRDYRNQRRRQQDANAVVQRRTVNVNTFAQVPLLNAEQLVNAWRELLPPVREPDYRRIPLDLSAPGVYLVEAVSGPHRAYTVVMIADVGLVTKAGPGQMLVFAADRFSGSPQAGCLVRVLADRQIIAQGETGSDGTFAAPIAGEADDFVAIARCGEQTVATDPGSYAVRQPTRELLGYIYTDRPVYRPAHVVHYKAVLRWRDHGVLAAPDRTPVEVSVVDESQKVLARRRQIPDEFGAITGDVTLPAAAALGHYRVVVARNDDSVSGTFEVQEYRKPEYDVSVQPATARALQGQSIAVKVTSRYYFGQPVARARVQYVLHKQSYFSPWRLDDGSGPEEEGLGWYGGSEELQGTAVLDASGSVQLTIPLPEDANHQDYLARIEARVIDDAGREVAGAGTVVATVGRFMVTARTPRYLYAPGSTAPVTVRAVDYDGVPQAGVPVTALLQQIDYRRGAEPLITDLQRLTATTGDDGRATITMPLPLRPGSFRLRTVATADGRNVEDIAHVYIAGSADDSGASEQALELVLDRKSYTPGEQARVLLRGAALSGPVLITKESQQLTWHQVVTARANEPFEVPVAADDVGDTYITMIALRDDQVLRAERRLVVPAVSRQLTVHATADKAVSRPGEPGRFTFQVTDANGTPVRAQLSIGMVDEALYGVRADTTADPLRFFYRREYNTISTQVSRDYSFVGYSGTEQLLLTRRRRKPFALADFKSERPDRPRVRKEFPDTAFWAGDIVTDAQGRASIAIAYPDSLTTWRLTARAVTVDTAVGATRTRTMTTKDLILRLVTPRFLTQGDAVTVPAIVHNYLRDSARISLSLTTDGLTAATAPATRVIDVPASGEQRTDWHYTADAVRPVRVTGKATSSAAGDAMEVTLPVNPAGLARQRGTAGSLVGDERERHLEFTIPPSANPAARRVRVSLAPSLAGTLLGGVDYLTSFPWGCTEQTLSSFVPNLVVLRTLADLKIGPTERLGALDRQIADGLRRLYDYQHDDGGWGWWKTDQNDPFMTAYALDGLLQAREHGVNVEMWRLQAARSALVALYSAFPRAVPDLKAYEVYVLARSAGAGLADPGDGAAEPFDSAGAIAQLWDARARMTASGRALLLMTLDRVKDGRGTELAGELLAAAETRGDLSWWPVDRDPLLGDIPDTTSEATALALEALAGREAGNPILERAARWLVVNRSPGGYWTSTKQTAFALRGLLAFMRARGEQPAPAFADVFINGVRAGSHQFDEKAMTSPDPVAIEAPGVEGANAVRIVRQGAGALYFDASVKYYDQPAASGPTGGRSLALLRRYAVLSPVTIDGRIVYRETPFTGSASVGDLILVRLTVAGSADWRYLMIEDPLPAGAEAVERDSLYELEQRPSWYWGSQRELRDDRVAFFQESLSGGRAEFSYLLKISTPGTFRAMPARVSPMYVPDVSASTDVVGVAITPGEAR